MEKTLNKVELIKLLIVFAIEICVTLLISVGLPAMGVNLPTAGRVLVLDIALIIPTVIYTFVKGDTLAAYGFRGIKVSTFFLTILLTFVSMPMYWFANVLSQFFTPNVLVQNMDNIMGNSVGVALLAVAICAPISEEIVMRGFFHNRFTKIMPFTAAAVLSGFLFGVLHLNLNQFCYAWVIGIVFAYTNRASGSILTSIIMHMLINASNVGIALLMPALMSQSAQEMAAAAEQTRQNGVMMRSYVVFFGILAVGSFFLTRLLIRAIAKRQQPGKTIHPVVEAVEL